MTETTAETLTETQADPAEERLGHWWIRLLMTALDAIDPRTAIGSLTSGDGYEIGRR
ncbi:hypothetical protein [Cellulomonas soli]|nr:hypothetical protein [Cellulomonas soli]NYI57294.1 hypothetical protein [Cellulomonas soli]